MRSMSCAFSFDGGEAGWGRSSNSDGRMGFEGQGDGHAALCSCMVGGFGKNGLVAEVNTIEVTDGNQRGLALELFHTGAGVVGGLHVRHASQRRESSSMPLVDRLRLGCQGQVGQLPSDLAARMSLGAFDTCRLRVPVRMKGRG